MARAARSKVRPPDIAFREQAVRKMTSAIGVYVLYDLDDVAMYVGQTVATRERGIRGRVQRHLTGARSDIIANRQLDVWEIAWVRTWPENDNTKIDQLEAALYHQLNPQSALMNGRIPDKPPKGFVIPPPAETIKVISDETINARRESNLRLPRQAEHYGAIVSHYLNVKDSAEIARSMAAHFERLTRYHAQMLSVAGTPPTGPSE